MSDLRCKEEYIRRIHKVQDYIENHLGQALSVEELAAEAGFSKYHFSRIFQALMQEPLAHYVNRIRMEQAVFLLAHREDKAMTDIAYELGMSDSAVFSRTFKNFYGISPRDYRKQYSKNCKESFLLSQYNGHGMKKEWEGSLFPVKGEITYQNMQEKQAVYVRHIGTYETLAKEYPALLKQLFMAAVRQNLLVDGQNWLLAMYHDNPEFGEESKFRTSMCLTVPEGIQAKEDGVLGMMTLAGGMYAVGHFEIEKSQYHDAWNYMYHEWIMGSGYIPRNYCPFEVYRNDPGAEESMISKVDIYVPVEPIQY